MWLTGPWTEAATYSAIAAACSAVAAIFSYQIGRKALSSKLTDRLYDFDRLVLDKAPEFAKFLNETFRPSADYFKTAPINGTDHIRLKAFVYFYLNLFDEIFAAYGTWLPFHSAAWKAWQHYMFERIKHPLVREVLLEECHPEIKPNGELVKNAGESVFTHRFIAFLMLNHKKWTGQCSHPAFW